ncbi:MAG TPA: asparagine synthase (glutamine-hydrolyzing) [Rhodocyclaceae bacterium]
MCGILGWLGEHQAADEQRFGAALDLLAHRGPDDRGVYRGDGLLLGHRRLSILDLSAAGHQPMVDSQSGAVIVFNGEIYNHVELRRELEARGRRFVGASDTEVLLYALQEWGSDALGRLNGMWAFALWNPASRTLLLARDRFGVKPLYYRHGPQGFAFASEPKALLELFPQHRKASRPALLDFLVNNALYANGQSFYEGIHVLPPAHFCTVAGAGEDLQLKRYWDYPSEIADELSAAMAAEQFVELFEDAVKIRLRADVPVGITLSGGLDSTAILAAAQAQSARPLTCFTSVYDGGQGGELEWARRASEPLSAPLLAVPAPRDNWLEVLRQVVWHMDGPGYSPAVYPLWCLMQRARQEAIPVLLEGQGADEALAGYPQYAVLELLAYARGAYAERRSIRGVGQRLQALRQTFTLRWAAAWMLREMWPQLVDWRRQRVGFQALLRPGLTLPVPETSVDRQHPDAVRQRLMHDHSQAILPGLLHYGDAISMAHSIEARHPFMDYRLVEWFFRLPTRHKLHQGETKWVLRDYLRTHGQQRIGNRRDKKGYPTPVGAWLASEQGEALAAKLLDQSSLLYEWCDPKKVRHLIEQNRQGVLGAEHHLYKLISAQMWLSVCIDGAR